jgi:zinc protease
MTQGRARLEVVVLAAWVAGGAGCTSAMFPRPGKPVMSDVQFRMRDFRLQNGMRIVVEEDHSTPLVAVVAVVGVGSSNDPPGREGLAHFLEHLAFRARPGGGPTAWSQLETAGVGSFNASTSLDQTTYLELGSRDLLPRLLTLEAGRLLDPLAGVDQRVFDVEREVVRNELRQRGENQVGAAFNYLQQAVFPPGHAYARPPIGTHESLTELTLDDARAFAALHYQPSNLTLVVIGDVDLAGVELLLKRSLPAQVFQPLPPTTAPSPARVTGPAAPPPAPPEARLQRHASTVAAPELYVVWSLPASYDAEAVLLDFVTDSASRSMGRAFWHDPDIVDVRAFSVPGVKASMLVARVLLHRGDHVERSYERVLDQLVSIWNNSDTRDQARRGLAQDREVAREASGAVVSMMLEAEDLLERGEGRARSTHFSGDPVTYSRRLRALGAVTSTQVARYAEAYLTRDRARAVLIEPIPPSALGALEGPIGLAPTTAQPLGARFPPAAVRQLGRAHVERHQLETVVKATPNHLEATFDNGLRVVVHRRPEALPVAVVNLTFPRGSAGASPRGAANLAMMLGFSRAHAQGSPSDFGMEWSPYLELDRSGLVGHAANGNLPNLLAQLSERVGSMTTEAGWLAIFHTDLAPYLADEEQLPVQRAERAVWARLFPGHPLGEAHLVADQARLGASDVVDWYRRAWNPAGAVLVITGDVEPTAALTEARRWFGSWRPSEPPLPPLPAPPLPRGGLTVLVTRQAGATQAQLHLACLADGATPLQEFAGRTTVKLLEAELIGRLRGELGASYGFRGASRLLAGGVQLLEWRGSLESARLAEGLAVLGASVKKLEDQGLTDRSLERARWAVASQLTVAGATSTAVSQLVARRVLAGRDTTNLESDFEVLATIGREQLLPGWRQCQGSLVLSLVGEEDQVRAALASAGLGTPP